MGDHSDGNKHSARKRDNRDSGKKARSYSVGSKNVEDKETQNKIKNFFGKICKDGSLIKNNDDNIQGIVNNKMDLLNTEGTLSQNQSNELDSLFRDPNEVFKPRLSISRTPPKKEDTVDESKCQHKVNGKRLRSEECSPEVKRLNKRQCETTSQNQQLDNDNQLLENPIEQSMESERLAVIMKALNDIEQTTNTNVEENEFVRERQDIIRQSTIVLLKHLTLMVHQIGELKNENILLKHTKCNTNVNLTYATMASNRTPSQDNSKSSERQKIPWTTPQTSNKIETIIRIPENEDAKKTIDKIKQDVKNKDVDGGFKNIRPIKGGAVIIESHTKSQQEKLRKALGPQTDLTIKEFNKTEPMFMVTGIEKGYSDEELVTELISQNPDVQSILTSKNSQQIEVVTRKTCRNPTKENVILRAHPNVAKWFLKKEIINFDLLATHIQEYVPLTMCFKCCGFGHVAKYCKRKECCHKCGEEHMGKDCTKTKLDCPNCSLMGYTERYHSARDRNCPAYKRKLDKTRQYINYNEDENFLG